MTSHTSRLIAVFAGLTLAFPDRQASAVNVGGTLACDTSCPDCGSCEAVAYADPATPSLASIDLSFDLGGAPFERPADYSAYHVAALANLGDRHLQQDFRSIMGYFDQAEVTNLWRSELRLKTDTITAATFDVASLEYNQAQKMEVIKVGGVVRQVLTFHFLVDVQELASPAEGFELKWYFAADKGAKSGGLYGLPGGTPVKHVTVSNPTPATYTTADVHSLMKTPNASQRKIHTRYVFETNGTTGRLEHRMETWTDKPSETGATKIEVETLDYLAGTPASNAKDYVRSLSRADLSAAGAYGSLTLISRVREKWSDIAGKSLMTEKIRLSGTASDTTGLKTTYGYYSGTGNTLIDGHRRWQKNYDGSWIVWDVTATQTTQTVKEIRPFEDMVSFVLADNGSNVGDVAQEEGDAFVTQTTTTGTQMTEVRSALGRQIGKTEKAFLTGSNGERIERVRDYYTASAYFETFKAFNPYGNGTAANAGRLAWETHQDGTATTYTYSLMGSDLMVTRRSGAATGTGETAAPAITAGSQTITSYNEFREIYAEAESDIESSLTTTFWTGSNEDLYGRPERVEYNGNASDFMTVTRTCCGPTETRDRTGAVTTHAYDLLKRQYRTGLKRSSTSTEIVTTTTRTGLTTRVDRTSDGITLLASESTGSLDGLTSTTKSPDANGDTLPETTSRATVYGVGATTTTTYPDMTQTISATYRDGSPRSSTDQENNVTNYSRGEHGEQGGGLWSKTTTPVSTQWTKTYSDHLGRSFKTEFPDGAISTLSYYGASDPSGSRGKVATMTDPDENATANTGSKVTYSYNTEGEQTTTAELVADGNTRTTVTATSVVNDAESGIGTASKSTTTVNSVLVSTDYSSVDGYRSKNVSFGRTSSSTRTVASNGGWTETSTTANGQTSVQTYLKGRLDKTEFFDNQTPPVSIASTAYTYDDFDRTLTTVDSRTGTTTINGYLENGSIISVKTNGGSDTTAYTYDKMGRTLTVTLPNTTATHTSYTPRGQVQAAWGSQTYATFRTYDALGRSKTLRTRPTLDANDVPTNVGGSVTTWNYDLQRGWLESKRDDDGKGADYGYTLTGRLKTRAWARIGTGGNRILTTYGYDRGMLESVTYTNDPAATPNLAYTYDAFGRVDQVTRGGVLHADYGYAAGDLVLLTERLNIETINRTLTRTYQDGTGGTVNLRPNGYTFDEGSSVWTYDSAGRHSTVSTPVVNSGVPGTDAWTYGYRYDDAGNDHLGVLTGGTESLTLFSINGPEVDTVLEYDEARPALLSRKNSYDGGTLSKFTYTVNELGQRDDVTPTGDAFTDTTKLSWNYNPSGELTTADRVGSTLFDRSYSYDAIGNRLTSTDHVAATTNYSADRATPTPTPGGNALNQYARITYPDTTSIDPEHDDDGNMTNGPVPGEDGLAEGVAVPSNAVLTWDAENRLVQIVVGSVTVHYDYDYLGRRMSRDDETTVTHYLYDGWNCVAEYTGTSTYTHQRSYVWGLDLSESPQGAGGVGGLLSIIQAGNSTRYYPTYDGNGNVSEYVNQSGAEVAHFEYDPFGNLTEDDQSNAASFPYRFSTKPQDGVSGLYYYGYRYLDPVTGRWPSRDPIEERGGINLYGFLDNDAIVQWEFLGLARGAHNQPIDHGWGDGVAPPYEGAFPPKPKQTRSPFIRPWSERIWDDILNLAEGEYDFEFGGGVGVGAWASVGVDWNIDSMCSDGSHCWDATISGSFNAGVILGGKLKVLGTGVDLSFVGPHVGNSLELSVNRDCDGIIRGGGRYQIIHGTFAFDATANVGLGPFEVGGNFKGAVQFDIAAVVDVYEYGMRVAFEGSVTPSGEAAFGLYKPGKRGKRKLAGWVKQFDVQPPKTKVFWEGFFRRPG